MAQADPSDQAKLLELAETDRAIGTARHRRASLPELAQLGQATPELDRARSAVVMAQTEVDDLASATRKLETEIEAVRARAARDNERLAAGAGPVKDLTNLQHELDTLARRQSVLEDQALELMEQSETAENSLESARRQHRTLADDTAAAEQRRDDAFADIDDELGRLAARRNEQTTAIPADLLALYERIHGSGKVAAGRLMGSQCGACRIGLDAVALGRIRAAAPTEVLRCEECGAILIRS